MITVHTNKAPAAIGPYSQAIINQGLVYTSGQIAINPETSNIEATTIEDQTRQVMINLSEILKEANSSMKNIIKTTCFWLISKILPLLMKCMQNTSRPIQLEAA